MKSAATWRITMAMIGLLVSWPGMSVQAAHAEENKSKLPPGCYIFIGHPAGSASPKYVTIGEDGSVRWQGGAPPGAPTPTKILPLSDSAPESNAPPPVVRGEFEKYEFPFIKWKPRLLSTGAIVQLETLWEPSGSQRIYPTFPAHLYGQVKYKANVLVRGNKLLPTNGVTFELLDSKGFSIASFSISGRDFSPVPGTSVLEGQGIASMQEDDYRKAVDYSVK